MGKKPDPVSNLADLMRNPGAGPPSPGTESGPVFTDAEEEAHVAEVNALLDFVAKRTDKNIFDMQALLAAGEDELRAQIREMMEGEDGD